MTTARSSERPRPDRAIAEIARCLRPAAASSRSISRSRAPRLARAYFAYLTVVGATVGTLLHRDPDTYRYIPASLARYPGAAAVAARLRAAGFHSVEVVHRMAGFMALHVAER